MYMMTTFGKIIIFKRHSHVFPYETDGDARRRALGCKFWILVSLRVFLTKRQYFKPPRSRLGFREETQNYANRSQILHFKTAFR